MEAEQLSGRLRVLTPNYYGMGFVTPRLSRHEIVTCPYKAPWRRVWRPLDAVAFGLPAGNCDVVHSYNRIPLTRKPWVLTFESWLPRTLSKPDLGLRRFLMRRLAGRQCRRILAMSDYAKNVFATFNEGSPHLTAALEKTEIVYPSVTLRADAPKSLSDGPIKVLFVGNDFAQKGGVAAVRLARLARGAGVPVEAHIVSAMRYGKSVFADCPEPGAYDSDIELLHGENVEMHGVLPNEDVLALMKACDFLMLTSLDDTFGFSVLEAMSVGTPAIVSNVCALPELVKIDENGIVVALPLDRYRKWTELKSREWAALNSTYDLFAEQALAALVAIVDHPQRYVEMSKAACERVRVHHEAGTVGARLDRIYEEAAA